jgi:ribosome-binding protein aMBF1 (putative translation factor)
MENNNQNIRKAIEKANLKYWQVADEIGISDTTFSKWLRHDLTGKRL